MPAYVSRERPTGDWILVSLALESETTVNNQERGKDWEYRVISVNKAGEGVQSNTVAAVVQENLKIACPTVQYSSRRNGLEIFH